MGKIYGSALDLIGNTPLVEIKNVEKSEGLEATVLAKLEYFMYPLESLYVCSFLQTTHGSTSGHCMCVLSTNHIWIHQSHCMCVLVMTNHIWIHLLFVVVCVY